MFGAGKVRRGLQYREGSDSPDVICPGFWIECKRGKRTNPRAALRQAIVDAKGKPVWPIAICRDDGEEGTVTLRLHNFVELLTEWNELKNR